MATEPKQLPFGLGERITLEMVLGMVFILAAVVSLLFVLSGEYPTAFWVSSAIALAVLAASKQKLALVGAAVAFIAIRFAFAALVTGRKEAIVGGIVAAGLLWGILWLGNRPERLRLAALVEGRRCPKCGAAVRKSRIVRAAWEEQQEDQLAVINRCACGEYTLFDASGSTRHVDPPPGEAKAV